MYKEFTIYKRSFAYELRKLGFKIIRVEPNPRRPELDCYIFKNSEEFQQAFYKISHPVE